MSFPPLQLQPISTSHYYVSGDVTIQEGAAIAPGVLIQADPDSQVVIKRGACIGIGSVLHAHHGRLEVGEGANIGAEVLLIGQVTIEAHACIGSATTIFNSSIARGQVVPPGSLIGDTSRSADADQPGEELQATDTVVYPASSDSQNGRVTEAEVAPVEPVSEAQSSASERTGVNVYGQMYVNQLLVKLFPNSPRSMNSLPEQGDKPPSAEDPWKD